MSAATWGGVHVGDTVRGADGRDYRVISTHPVGVWVGSGQTEILLQVKRDEETDPRWLRRVAGDAAALVERADHSDTAAAWSALAGAGLAPELIGETMATETATMMDPAPSTARGEAPKGKWGWYKLPNPTWGEPGDQTELLLPRVTTIAGTLDDEYGLTAWKLRMAVKGVALRPDLIARAAAADTTVDKGTLDKIVESAMEKAEAGAAANFGSAMHKFAERLDAGESIAAMGVPQQLRADLEAYAAALRSHGLEVLPDLSERTVVNVDDQYAGTWDRVVRDRSGALYVLDLKTGQDLSYGWLKAAVQQAMYSRAAFMCTRGFATYEPAGAFPAVDQMKALIMHLPLGAARAQVYGVPLDKGWHAARAALAVRKMRSDAKGWNWLLKPDEPADVIRLHLDRAQTVEALLEVGANARKRGLWTVELEAYALNRYDLIRINGATRAELADIWAELHPAGRWSAELGAAAEARVAYLVRETGIK